jgi:hypothetical protein
MQIKFSSATDSWKRCGCEAAMVAGERLMAKDWSYIN